MKRRSYGFAHEGAAQRGFAVRAARAMAAGSLLLLACMPTAQAANRTDQVTSEMVNRSVIELEAKDTTYELERSIEDMAHSTETGATIASDVLFEFGKSEISDESKKIIEDTIQDIPQGASVTVDGYTDSIGDDATNQTLSEDRANAVKDVIMAKRSDLKVTAQGHGESDPVADNGTADKDNPEGRAKNRRVELSF